MTYINAYTKRGQAYIKAIENATLHTLSQCYSNYSYNKERAYNWCLEQYTNDNGTDFHIISYNCNFFTVGWKIYNWNDNKYVRKDGEILEYVYRIETAYNSYIIY